MRARGSGAWLLVAVAVAAPLVGCVSDRPAPEDGSDDPAIVIAPSLLDADFDGEADWVMLALLSAPHAVLRGEELLVEATDTNSVGHRLVCRDAILVSYDQCAHPFGVLDRWREGSVLFVPCRWSSSANLTVTFQGQPLLDEWRALCSVDRDDFTVGTQTRLETASVRAAALASSDDGQVDYLRLTLQRGENAPYDGGVVNVTTVWQVGARKNVASTGLSNRIACVQPMVQPGPDPLAVECAEGSAFTDADSWEVGETLYIPCQADLEHRLVVTILQTHVLDVSLTCQTVPS